MYQLKKERSGGVINIFDQSTFTTQYSTELMTFYTDDSQESTAAFSSSPMSTGSSPVSSEVKKRSKDSKSKTTKLLRSRFGCEHCKNKRVKCDESRPICSRCKSMNLACNYKVTLQFREDLERKGKKFGREGVWLKTKKKSQDTATELAYKSQASYYLKIRHAQNLQFINFGHEDIITLSRLFKPLQASIIPHDISNCYSYDHPSLNFALSYYIDFISPIFNPIKRDSFHYIEEVVLHGTNLQMEMGLNMASLIQYSQNYNHIFYLILSLGSVYVSKFQKHDKNWILESQRFRKLGMAQLMDKLIEIEFEDDPQVSTDLILSMVLLIMYELANDCNGSWSTYLEICRKLKSSRNFHNPMNDLEASLLRFSLEFLHYQESMGRTACKAKNSFFMIMEDEVKTQENQGRVISWMGCERGLVDVVSDITDLSFERLNQAGMNEKNYNILCDNIRNRLKTMELNIDIGGLFYDLGQLDGNEDFNIDVADSELIIMDPVLDIEQFCFILSCEIKTFATEIYLECCLLNKSPHDEKIRKQVDKICKMLKYIILKNDFKWCSTLLWSIFVVGVEISNKDHHCEELRYLVLQMLDKLETNSLGNVNAAREVIMNVWKKRDLDEDGEYHRHRGTYSGGDILNTGFINDWETYVSDKRLKISLA